VISLKLAVGIIEAAELVDVSPQLIREWCTNNVLPYLKVGNKFLVRTDMLDEFLRINEGKDLKQFNTLVRPGFAAK
jgi:excisionase family DNA binding protein